MSGLRRLAEQGHADAQCNLGDAYYFGEGVAQDYAEAVKWFLKAADIEFKRERTIMRRATERLAVEFDRDGAPGVLDGGELRSFLMNLDEFQWMFHKLQVRLCDSRVVEILRDTGFRIDIESDFTDRANLDALAEALEEAGVNGTVEAEQDGSAWSFNFSDSLDAQHRVNVELSRQPEYRVYRNIARQIAIARPPFVVVKDGCRDELPEWHSLLSHMRALLDREGERDSRVVQRYSGLGGMNSEGYAHAQYVLGLAYNGGLGVPKDHAEAAKWFRKAAGKGHVDAQNQLREGSPVGQ